MAGFAESLAMRSAATRGLSTVRGELRDSYGYTWTLQGTLGTRASLKRRHAVTERALVRDVEPWVALATRAGSSDRRHLLRAAWRPVLLCQPHDTLCGCSVDEVADAMRARLAEADAAAHTLRADALADVLRQDADAARATPEAWQPVVVVRNPAARPRGGVAELDVDIVLAESPVGPQSANVAVRPSRPPLVSIGDPAVPVQLLERTRIFVREESPTHYPRNRLIERRRVLAWVPPVPGYGIGTLPIRQQRGVRTHVPLPVTAEARRIAGEPGGVDALNGVVLRWRGGRDVADWLTLEVDGERGDLYTASAIPGTRLVAAPARVRVTRRGPLRAEVAAEWRLRLPARRLTSAAGQVRRLPPQRIDVRAAVQLDAGAPFVRIVVAGENAATDCRLRLVVRTGLAGGRTSADAAFGPVIRESVRSAPGDTETAPPTAPLHRYVSVFSRDAGATVFSDGLTEYETRDDGSIAVTLFRAVGELSRHDLPERPGHAGYPAETPGAQERGAFGARLAFAFHGPHAAATAGEIERMAEDALFPLVGHTLRTAIDPPSSMAGVQLDGDGLAFSTAKPSETGEWMVLRCVNLVERSVEGAWQVAGMTEARAARLDETPLDELRVETGTVRFVAPPRGIVTVLVR
jgi:hypothetical protein